MTRRRPSSSARAASQSDTTPADLLREETGDLATGEGRLRVAVVSPNSYSVGMASLGFHLVRQWIRETGSARVERAFAGVGPAAGRSLETGTPLGDFHVLAFSVAFELDYLNVLDLLERAGIPLFASRRGRGFPLVVAGGTAISINRHAIYPFCDLLVHGEGEDLVAPLVQVCHEHAGDRPRLLDAARRIPGVEVTAGAWRAAGETFDGVPADLDERVERADLAGDYELPAPRPALARDLAARDAASRIVTPRSELGRRVLVEIARGCPHHCTFCWLGHNCREFLPRSAASVIAMCDEPCAAAGCESVGLISAAVASHPEIDAICEGMLARGRQISFASLRAEEIRPSILEALVRSGQRSLTLAPEAGDERLRRLLGKQMTDDAFAETVDRTQRAGLADLKLYFMTGLPTETEPEALRIVSFVDRIRRVMLSHGRARGRLGALSVNLGVYVPKPNTPLARMATPDFAGVRRRVKRVMEGLAALPNVRAALASVDLAAAQRLLSMGGFETAVFLLKAHRSGGQWRSLVRRRMRGA
jgi:radical SAM superfamily enzyme YgiQ (UPF0313 family)